MNSIFIYFMGTKYIYFFQCVWNIRFSKFVFCYLKNDWKWDEHECLNCWTICTFSFSFLYLFHLCCKHFLNIIWWGFCWDQICEMILTTNWNLNMILCHTNNMRGLYSNDVFGTCTDVHMYRYYCDCLKQICTFT